MEKMIQHKLMPWFVVFSASLFFFYQFTQMNIISSLAPYLMRTFSINATHLGNLEAAYFFATILFLLPAGQILDRISTRKVILSVLMISILGTFAFALSPSYWAACISRFVTGIADAFCFLSGIHIASRWFSNEKLAFVSGLVATMGMLGGTMAQTPLALLIKHTGNWHYAIILDGILGFIIWILIFIYVKDHPSEQKDRQHQDHQELRQFGYWKAMRFSYGKIRNWFCGLYSCFISLPVFLIGGGAFGSLYLQQVKHMTTLQASYPPMMIFFGMAVGSPLMGWISDKLNRRKLPMQLGAIICTGLILCIIYLSVSLTVYAILFFLLGFISSTGIISYALVTESNVKILTATSISIISFVTLSGSAIFPPLFGHIMDKGNDFKIVHNIHVYSALDYHRAMLVMPITMIIALMVTFFIRETYCKPTPTSFPSH